MKVFGYLSLHGTFLGVMTMFACRVYFELIDPTNISILIFGANAMKVGLVSLIFLLVWFFLDIKKNGINNQPRIYWEVLLIKLAKKILMGGDAEFGKNRTLRF